jgi:hypothetical protein
MPDRTEALKLVQATLDSVPDRCANHLFAADCIYSHTIGLINCVKSFVTDVEPNRSLSHSSTAANRFISS